ncbi:MAG: two-component system, cell cycle response regulator [Acidimicrobiaceae bacterium]|jgi:two-component system cell cycle response regulator
MLAVADFLDGRHPAGRSPYDGTIGLSPDPEQVLARLRRVEDHLRNVERRLVALEQFGFEFRRALTRLGDALAATHDRPAMVSAVLEVSALFLGASAGVFYTAVAGSDRMRPLTTFGEVDDEPPDLVGAEGVAGAAGAQGRVVVWPGHEAPRPSASEPPAGAVTAVAVPVRSDGHPFGVLALYGRMSGLPFSAADVETLQTLVRQAETAIDNSYLYDEAKRLSLTDGLTGLWNSRHFELRLGDELSRAVRFDDDYFSLVLCDLDNFKGVNDTYGHQAGNSVLVELARRLMESTREVDIVSRLSGGGDEFALILPRTGLAGAIRLADKVRAAVGDEPFRTDGVELAITMSLGVASFPEHGKSEKELKAAADSALYRAKRLGGNRVDHAKVGE